MSRLGVLALLLGVSLASSASAGLRSRELPFSSDPVEPSLRHSAAAATVPGARIHVLLRTDGGTRRSLERSGVRLLRSVDGDLWLASLPAAGLARGEVPAGVDRAWRMLPGDRASVQLRDALERAAGTDAEVALRVKVFADVPEAVVRERLASLGARVGASSARLGLYPVRIEAARTAELLALDEVRWVEAAPRAPEAANNGLRFDAEVNVVQAFGFDGSGVVVGMWDVAQPDTTHPDMAGRVHAGEAGGAGLHPTHVAGIVLGDGTNSALKGGNPLQWRGVAPGASMWAYDAFDAVVETDSAIAMHDIDVSTNSWLYPVDSTNCSQYGDYAVDAPEFDAIVTGIFGKPIPVVFAAGNERDDLDCGIPAGNGYGLIPPPATGKNVIAVGAHHSDVLYMTPFSSWGPTDDGRMKPDVSAPGCQINDDGGITSTTLLGGYLTSCGTSMATPAVSGIIAQLTQAWRTMYAGDPRPATHKALLGGFAKDRAGAGPDYRFGLGAVHAEASLNALRTATTVEDDVEDAQTDLWTFTVPAGTDTLAVTLAWDDVPGAELADTSLVNDLDLELVDPSAGVHLPFVLNPADPSALAVPGVNRLDNVEQVRVLSPAPGTWTARVIGFQVPDGPQGYSLVGFDRRPPADAVSAIATAQDDSTVALSWIRAGDVDRAGTLVVRSGAPVAWTPVDGASYTPGAEVAPGVFVVSAEDGDHSGTPLLDVPVAPATLHHYAFFSYDEIPNYSPGVADDAETTGLAVGAPIVAADVARPRFERRGANPSRGPVEFRLELPRTQVVVVDVHDVRGRRVATILNGEVTTGARNVTWNGRGDDGRPVAAGLYFVRVRSAELNDTLKIVMVR
jgi:hypothetical protein